MMAQPPTTVLPKLFAGLSALLLFGCQSEVSAPPAIESGDELRMTTQQLGEASTPLYTPGTGLEPSYRARMMAFMSNRIRMAPHLYGLRFERPMDSGQFFPFIPTPPGRLDAFMTEPGRWAVEFQAQTGCFCTAEDVGYDPMDRTTRDRAQYVGATCCDLDVVGGVAQCVSPLVPCDHPRATLVPERWAKLNLGVSRILDESFSVPPPMTAEVSSLFEPNTGVLTRGLRDNDNGAPGSALGLSIMPIPQVPPECLPVEKVCEVSCQDFTTQSEFCDPATNADCVGVCAGGSDTGMPCKLPQMAECDPETYPVIEALVFATGETQAPVPVLSDGIHANLSYTNNGLLTPDGVTFYPTPEGETSFAVHYYETNGDPIGTPQSIQVVLDGTCQDMSVYATPDVLPVTNEPAPYSGDLFVYDTALTEGCYPYVFVAKDGVGFEYTYPTYGALQAKIDAEGNVALNDDTCPIWTSTRPDLSCSPSPQECQNGDTRPCYTGFYGTQDNGACAPGVETCNGGRWSGSCADQILPESVDICHDGIDNDCNGGVDEDCFCDWLDDTDGVCFQAPKSPDRECIAPATYEETETQCDGLDNDCDGIIDENCPCNYNGDDAGVCTTAMRDAQGFCIEPQGFEDSEALCDNLDNDCDGAIDEGCECDYLGANRGVCAAQTRDEDGVCAKPDNYEEDETSCDGRDNNCDGDTDEGCASSCETSLDCRWEDGHGCEGRTTAGEKFCTTEDESYRSPRTEDATTNPECIDDADCNGLCDTFGLKCVDGDGRPTSPKTASGEDTCGSPLDCPLDYTCQSREGKRQCVSPSGEVLEVEDEDDGCNGCQSAPGKLPTNLPLLGAFGLIMLARRRRRHAK